MKEKKQEYYILTELGSAFECPSCNKVLISKIMAVLKHDYTACPYCRKMFKLIDGKIFSKDFKSYCKPVED